MMKTIANLGTIQQAQNLRLILGSRGIEVFIPDEVSAGIAPHHFMNATGIRLQVDEAVAEEAYEIVQAELDAERLRSKQKD